MTLAPDAGGGDGGRQVGRALEGLDRLLDHRSRLAICVLLAREGELSFSHFKSVLDESDGNLGAHLRRLEDAGHIALRKGFVGRKPQSSWRLTNAGRQRLAAHLEGLRALIDDPG